MKLVIVESPAKAKTIEKFLGSDYKVAASYGHIRDLPSSAREIPAAVRDKPWARLAVDTDGDFAPVYVVPKDSKERVKELKKMLQGAEELLLATDEDREGESISWHLLEVLQPEIPVRRITFHEITRSAIQEALEHPRDVDEQLVRAQETRRILDRLYGYSLSPVLWKKVRTKLSAGRVQSVALRLIVEREEERQAFRSSEFWDVSATFSAGGDEFTATLVRVGDRSVATSRDFDATTGVLDPDSTSVVLDESRTHTIAIESEQGLPWSVSSIERKETRQRPAPPFTTSTLQQAASSNLRMSPKRTMRVAQKLYEGVDLGGGDREGLITYMRTDSVTLSQKALADAASFIRGRFGDEFHDGPRVYKTKSKSAQEAHEAIRPSEVQRTPEDVAAYLSPEELSLYRLIWSRTVASQMTDARLDRTTVELSVDGSEERYTYRASGSILRFPGFLSVMGRSREDTLLPAMEEGDRIGARGSEIELVEIAPDGHETRPPPRYTEASLVKKLEEEGIGRPSTYTPTISTIQDREYVVKKGTALVPTYVGMAVVHLLREHFPQYVDIKFTARMEDRLDDIAEGEEDWRGFLTRFYKGGQDSTGLVKRIEDALPNIDYPAIPVGTDPESGQPIHIRIGRSFVYAQRGDGGDGNRVTLPVDLFIDELTPERVHEMMEVRSKAEEPITTDPDSGLPVFLRTGPYGPYVQLGEPEEDSKPKRVSLPRGMSPEDLTEADALRLISLPRPLGDDPDTGKPVVAGLGRYGPYVERGGTYRNVKDFDRLFTVTLDEALELIRSKPGKTVLREVGEHPESGKPLQVLSGRYGPYVTDGKVNASLPKAMDPSELTIEESVQLLIAAAERKKKRRASKS